MKKKLILFLIKKIFFSIKKKRSEFDEFFKKITPIIENYVSEKKIDIVLDKKNIFIASKKKNITQEIIKIIDTKIK